MALGNDVTHPITIILDGSISYHSWSKKYDCLSQKTKIMATFH